MSQPPRIRPIAICLFAHARKILVARYFDRVKQQAFYRPLGGGIEFGETAAATVAREVREEVGADVRDLKYLFTMENLFTHNGQPGHEIVMVYDGVFVDESYYGRQVIRGRDSDSEFDAVWKELRVLSDDPLPLYPDGLLERLSEL
jgi:8-oxo-dGTP pyrophosphatase MutT (NUDIX family)